MPPTQPGSPDLDEILSSRRIGAALGVLTDPGRDVTDNALRLSEDEREMIRQALDSSSHPLAGFARRLVEEWDHADPHDRVAGLFLFSEITVGPQHRQHRDLGRSPGPGLGR